MDEATERKMLAEMMAVDEDGVQDDEVEAENITPESALQVLAAAFHSESRAFPFITSRGGPPFFRGQTAVAWMKEHFQLKTRDEAVFIGQALIDAQFMKPKSRKNLLDEFIIGGNRDGRSKEGRPGETEDSVLFLDTEDKQYTFQKAPLMMESYIRNRLPSCVSVLLKGYSPPTSKPVPVPTPLLSPRRSTLSSELRGLRLRTATTTPIPLWRMPSQSSPDFLAETHQTKVAQSLPPPPPISPPWSPTQRRRSASVSSDLPTSILIKGHSDLPSPLGSAGSPLGSAGSPLGSAGSPLGSAGSPSPRLSRTKRASVVLRERFMIFRDGLADRENKAKEERDACNNHNEVIPTLEEAGNTRRSSLNDLESDNDDADASASSTTTSQGKSSQSTSSGLRGTPRFPLLPHLGGGSGIGIGSGGRRLYGHRRGKSMNSDIMTVQNPLFRASSGLDLGLALREAQECRQEKQARREARRRRRAERGKANAQQRSSEDQSQEQPGDDWRESESSECEGSIRSRGGSSECDSARLSPPNGSSSVSSGTGKVEQVRTSSGNAPRELFESDGAVVTRTPKVETKENKEESNGSKQTKSKMKRASSLRVTGGRSLMSDGKARGCRSRISTIAEEEGNLNHNTKKARDKQKRKKGSFIKFIGRDQAKTQL